MFKAYPRHFVEITNEDYRRMISFLFISRKQQEELFQEFEQQFARYIGTKFALSVPSARLGLYATLYYFNFPRGAEVIISPFTHQSIFTILKTFGLKPVFVDIEENTHNINPQLVKRLITKKTQLLILTHMWGQPCDMDAFIKLKGEHNLKIIEDCAMSAGATYKGQKTGSFFDASIFSFGKAKAICTFGGGMLCFSDIGMKKLISKLINDFHPPHAMVLTISVINSVVANVLTRPRLFFSLLYPLMRFLDIRDLYNPVEHKKNSEDILECVPEEWKVKTSAFQSAVGVEQLKTLDQRNNLRIQNAQLLNFLLKDIPKIDLPVAADLTRHIYLYYVVCIKQTIDLNYLRKKLLELSVDTQLNELTNPEQLHIFGADSRNFPVFKKISASIIVIPNGIYLNNQDIYIIADALKRCLFYKEDDNLGRKKGSYKKR